METTERVVEFRSVSNGHASSTNVGTDASITEIFPWRPEGDGKAPIRIEVRPHALKQGELGAIDAEVEKAAAARALVEQKRTKLIEKRTSLQADLYIEQEIDEVPEDESEFKPKRNKVNTLLAEVEVELEATPTAWEKRAELFFVPVVKQWPLTYLTDEGDELPIAITPKDIATKIDPVRLAALHNDMQRFLFRDRSKKKK